MECVHVAVGCLHAERDGDATRPTGTHRMHSLGAESSDQVQMHKHYSWFLALHSHSCPRDWCRSRKCSQCSSYISHSCSLVLVFLCLGHKVRSKSRMQERSRHAGPPRNALGFYSHRLKRKLTQTFLLID